MTRLMLPALLLCASVVSAQTPVTSTSGIAFGASPDQTTVAADGITPILTRYEMRFTATIPASCAPASAVNLGKPTPTAGTITVAPVAALGTLPANCVYTAVIAAMGPGGEGVSGPTTPFVRVVPKAPAATGTPTIVP